LDLLLKERDNGTRRVIGLEAGGERMSKQIVLCTLFIGVQGIVDNELEFWRTKTRTRTRRP
jgi:hypothetical protein